ncbi:hypothetical protein [Neptunicella marina]|uniref:Uncharacterized protein n=1 Tax=Neptunicella marina TaxID=2125989 RepID=A0A8J6M381_9ALTE|nr:hypothetical protein [Neptunicella marina]MBC3767228.1 hypothetical protein [Neptunicella marina]
MKGFIFLILLLLPNLSQVESAELPSTFERPQKLLVTYVDHPSIKPYLELFTQVYQQDLHIDIELRPIPAMRGLIQLEKGLTDADVIRVPESIASFENIVEVEPQLGFAQIQLLCLPGELCDLTILENPALDIETNMGNSYLLQGYNIKAQLHFNENMQSTLNMLRAKRIKYAIFVTPKNNYQVLQDEFNQLPLKTVKLIHIINKKYAPLLPELTKSLQKRLPSFQKERHLINLPSN